MSLLKKLSNAAFVLNCLKIIGLLMGMVTHAPLLVPRTRCRTRCCRPCRRTGLTEQVLEAPASAAAFLRVSSMEDALDGREGGGSGAGFDSAAILNDDVSPTTSFCYNIPNLFNG
ncbi:unnamed protein product [Plutella xylostella]|uniref:(diamondback moth) hypothetical protein n=1 Tax=Plutella xylostella TaxID=51655 RepID=A0A8S4E3S1_PLUXY|nr:unnamed protein product [Plutella xylostella]